MDDIAVDENATTATEEMPVRTHLIPVRDAERPEVVRLAIDAIRNHVFQKGNQLVRPIKTLDGVTLTAITPEALDLLLNQRCLFDKLVLQGRGDERGPVPVACAAPPWLAKQICNLQTWRDVRLLDSVARVPYLRPNGTVGGLESGYDGPAKCWSITGTRWLEVLDSPSDDDAKQALATLVEVVDEFPFADDSGRSVFVATLLSIVARRAIKGPVPLTLIDASTPGSGKTLLATVIAFAATGRIPGVANAGSDENELRKAITAHLQSGEPVLVFDNCTGKFGGPTIDRFITSTIWSDRLLGTNRTATLQNETVVLVTANNASVQGDTARRSISVTLRPRCERPEERSFRHPNLVAFVESRKRELIHAALTILRWHIAKGKPQHTHCVHIDADGNKNKVAIKPFGSFEEWSRMVRHAVIGLGLPDPVQTAEGIRQVDEASAQRRAFLEALAAWKFDWQGTSKSLLEDLYGSGEATEATRNLRAAIEQWVEEKGVVGQRPSPKNLGYRMREVRERHYSGLTLRWLKHGCDGAVYQLVAKQDEA